MARKRFTVFNLSFLDIMSCGFGAVVLFFMIISAQVSVRSDQQNEELLGETNRIEEEVLEGRKGLVRLQTQVDSQKDQVGKLEVEAESLAAMIKELDPNHPTMTTTAFVHGQRIEFLHNRSPAIDIHGVNAYGGAQVVVEFLRDGGATKPFVLTEFGPVGPWEMPTTEWGAPYEQTSTEKAAFYADSYGKAITAAPGMALGSYAFLWGNKMEATETWFGMLLPDGAQTAAVDAMTEIWSGEPPANLAPTVAGIQIGDVAVFDPGAEIDASTVVTARFRTTSICPKIVSAVASSRICSCTELRFCR